MQKERRAAVQGRLRARAIGGMLFAAIIRAEIFVCVFVLLSISIPAESGTVYGQVRYQEKFLSEKTLELRGKDGSAFQVPTDAHGNYEVFLPPGPYTANFNGATATIWSHPTSDKGGHQPEVEGIMATTETGKPESRKTKPRPLLRRLGNQLLLAVVPVAVTGVIGIITFYIAQHYQAIASDSTLLTQRDQAESTLRAGMFRDLIGPIVGQQRAGAEIPVDRERLLVEMLTLNFHENVEFRPLLLHTYTRLTNKDRSCEATIYPYSLGAF